MPQNAQIDLRRDTAANWTSVNPVLALGEPGFETDNKKLKIGDGTTAWTALTYVSGAAKIAVGTVAPSSPATNDLWVDTN